MLLLLLTVDLLFVGGGMTGGMMAGVAGMMGTPWGWLLVLLLAAALLVMLAGR